FDLRRTHARSPAAGMEGASAAGRTARRGGLAGISGLARRGKGRRLAGRNSRDGPPREISGRDREEPWLHPRRPAPNGGGGEVTGGLRPHGRGVRRAEGLSAQEVRRVASARRRSFLVRNSPFILAAGQAPCGAGQNI